MTQSTPVVDDDPANTSVEHESPASTGARHPFQMISAGDASAVCEIDGECA